MIAAVVRDQTSRTITIKVSDVPDIDATRPWHTRPQSFQPEQVVIEIVDGDVDTVRVSGPQRLNAGRLSTMIIKTERWSSTSNSQNLLTAPGWVVKLVKEASEDVVYWSKR